MTMQFSNEDAETIRLARKHVKTQKVLKFAILTLIVILYLASTQGFIDAQHFMLSVLVIAIFAVSDVSFLDISPSYNELLSLIEQKVPEDYDPINRVKGGTHQSILK